MLTYHDVQATGWAVSPHLLVTANHFAADVPDGGAVQLRYPHRGADEGRIVKRGNAYADLALIQSNEVLAAPYLELASEPVTVGQRVWAIGYGSAGSHPTALAGIVSSTYTDTFGWGRVVTDIQSQRGHSGSPVLDVNGKVVGVLVSNMSNGGLITFLVPGSVVSTFLEGLR